MYKYWHSFLKRYFKYVLALEILCPSKVKTTNELDRLKEEIKNQKNLTFLSLRKLFKEPQLRVGLFLVCFLQVAQQLSGINTVSIIFTLTA